MRAAKLEGAGKVAGDSAVHPVIRILRGKVFLYKATRHVLEL